MVLFLVRIVIEGGPPSNLEERSWVSPDSAILVRRPEPIRTARPCALIFALNRRGRIGRHLGRRVGGVGDYSLAKGPRGLEAPNGNSTAPRASTPKGTRLLRISAKGVHGGTVILYCQRPAWRASSTHIGLD